MYLGVDCGTQVTRCCSSPKKMLSMDMARQSINRSSLRPACEQDPERVLPAAPRRTAITTVLKAQFTNFDLLSSI